MFDGNEGSRREFLEILIGQGEEPAFLTRSREVSQRLERFHQNLDTQHEKHLEAPRKYLVSLARRAGFDWTSLSKFLVDGSKVSAYQDLFEAWDSQRKLTDAADVGWDWSWSPRRPLIRFHQSVEQFNRTWGTFLKSVDLQAINQTLGDYNAHYPIEKVCAFGIEDIERLGFSPMPLIAREELFEEYPKIELPRLNCPG